MRLRWIAAAVLAGMLVAGTTPAAQRAAAPPAPVIVFETAKGSFEIELFPQDAPKSVEHIVALVRRNFYRALRFHRANASLVQIGDPLTRDMSRQAYWGSGGSGQVIGVAEISKTRKHVRGTVGMAHAGNAAYADSQFYIMKRASPSLDGDYAIIGRVTTGMEVVDKIEVTDLARTVTIKAAGPPSR